jgi:flagellar hook-associated protein 1
MPSIIDGLYVAQRALYAQQFGLQVTQQNIANVNTPGYSRQRTNFIAGVPPMQLDQSQAGMGVSGVFVDSFRDKFIDFRVNQEMQGQGEQNSVLSALQQVEVVINASGDHDLQAAMSDFFNSFSALSAKPEDLSLRQDVVSKGTALTGEFNRLYNTIQGVQTAQDQIVVDTLGEINTTTAGIAQLNARIGQLRASQSPEESIAVDQRQQLLDQLSSLADVTYFETETGAFTVTTKQGALLVVGDENRDLQAVPSTDGTLTHIEVDNVDITDKISSGKLGGVLQARDKMIPGYLKTLDDMAATLTAQVNAQHALGKDYRGIAGGNFFVPFVQPALGDNTGAARGMTMAIADPNLIAAAGVGGGPGDNANALLLAGIKDAAVFGSGTTANQIYANLVAVVGEDLRRADNLSQTQTQVLTQLENQRDSFSGVNLDEEATNIMKYQKAYQASARFVQVLNTLSDEIINLLGY